MKLQSHVQPFATQRNILTILVSVVVWQSIGLGLANGQNRPSSAIPKGAFPKTVRTETNTSWPITGVVTGPTGLPVAHAKITNNFAGIFIPMATTYRRTPVDEVHSDSLGNYKIKVFERNQVVVDAPGLAPGFFCNPEGSHRDIQLETGREIRGTVYGLNGEPAKSVKVTPVNWLIPIPEKFQFRDSRPNPDISYRHAYAGFPDQGKSRVVMTDQDGKFRIPNMPSKYRVAIAIEPDNAKGEVVFVRTDNGNPEKDFANQNLRDNDFEFYVSPCPVLKLNAVDEQGQPSDIERVIILPVRESGNRSDFRREIEVKKSSAIIPMVSYNRGTQVYIQPVKHEELLGRFVQLPPFQNNETIEHEIVFEKGYTVEGSVVGALDQEPIPDVSVGWVSAHTPFQRHINKTFPAMNVKTDRAGQFRIAVPEEDCVLGIQGQVDDYIGASTALQNFRAANIAAADDLKFYFRPLSRNEVVKEPRIEFRMRPSIDAKISVVKPDGSPSSDAVVVIGKLGRTSIGRSRSSKPYISIRVNETKETLTCNSQGKVDSDSVFYDIVAASLAEQSSDETDSTENHAVRAIESTDYQGKISWPRKVTVDAFSEHGLQYGQATIAMPKDLATKKVEVIVTLENGGDVFGRIIGHDGKPVEDLEIVTSSFSHQWTTRTREDGWFKMSGIRPAAQLSWKFAPQRVKQRHAEMAKLTSAKVLPATTTLVGDVIVDNYSVLAQPLPELNIDDLDNDAALQKITEYILKVKKQIPTDAHNSVYISSDDPLPVFHRRVVAKLQPYLQELADRQPGTDFELRTINVACEHLLQLSEAGRLLGRPANSLVKECRERLLKNHAERDEAQSLILRLTSSFGTSVRNEPSESWSELFEYPVQNETKATAAANLFAFEVYAIRKTSMIQSPDVAFKKRFKTFKANLEKSAQHIASLDSKKHPFADRQIRRMAPYAYSIFDASQWNQGQEKMYEPKRAKLILKELNKYKDKFSRFMD